MKNLNTTNAAAFLLMGAGAVGGIFTGFTLVERLRSQSDLAAFARSGLVFLASALLLLAGLSLFHRHGKPYRAYLLAAIGAVVAWTLLASLTSS